MGYVDTLTRFTHYNSYRLDPGEELIGTPFDVEFFSAISSQAQVICKGATSEGAMYMTWLAEDGSKLSRDEYEFDVTGRWVRQIWPNEPPEHAVRAMWSVKNTDDTEAWNVACAMTSAGEMAGAFDPSLASQVSLLNAQGLYTGIVSANQVIAGILQSLDGKAYFDLEKSEIVMEGTQADLSITPENPLNLTDKQGNFIGGLTVSGGKLYLVSTGLTTSDGSNYIVTAGETTTSTGSVKGVGIQGFNLNQSTLPIANLTMARSGLTGNSSVEINTNRQSLTLQDGSTGDNSRLHFSNFSSGPSDRGSTFQIGSSEGLYFLTGPSGMATLGHFQIQDDSIELGAVNIGLLSIDNAGSSFSRYSGGGLHLYNTYTSLVHGIYGGVTIQSGGPSMYSGNMNHYVGVDNTGPYFIKNGVKTYL